VVTDGEVTQEPLTFPVMIGASLIWASAPPCIPARAILRLIVATIGLFKFMGFPPVRSIVINCHLDWSPHKQRRSAVSIHFNVWMPVEVSSFEEPPALSPHTARRVKRATRDPEPR
jgi:hypothetical protein